MKVRFRQSGGFAGLVRGCELSAADLTADEAQELARLVQAAGLDRVAPSPARGADRQGYEIAVEGGNVPAADVQFTDADLTDEISALVAFLRARARPLRPD